MAMPASKPKPKKVRGHDHRRGLWIISGGSMLWCYQCGAIRPNRAGRLRWAVPTGDAGSNPHAIAAEWDRDQAGRASRCEGRARG